MSARSAAKFALARSSAVYITLTNEPPDGDLDFCHPTASDDLKAETVWVGADEVMVVFDDGIATGLGLQEAISVGSRPAR